MTAVKGLAMTYHSCHHEDEQYIFHYCHHEDERSEDVVIPALFLSLSTAYLIHKVWDCRAALAMTYRKGLAMTYYYCHHEDERSEDVVIPALFLSLSTAYLIHKV